MSHIVLYYHIVWRTKSSARTLTSRDMLYAYIMGLCKKKSCWLSAVGGYDDHVHLFVSIRHDLAISEFIKVLKGETSKWMKEQRDLFPHFEGWGTGYAAFTYCERDKGKICRYIERLDEHHRRMSFREEYAAMLKAWGINPETDYLLRD